MKFFVGVTDNKWFEFLAQSQPDEVNFWKPGGQVSFKVLEPGGLFLFKLHSPLNFIVGGGYFVSYSRVPLSLAWLAFEQRNGVSDESTFRRVIHAYKRDASLMDPEIGCIMLTEPFFLPRNQWIPAPASWPPSAVQGKSYSTDEPVGRDLWEQVQHRLSSRENIDMAMDAKPAYGSPKLQEGGPRYSERMTKQRIGQGSFRVLVTEAYERHCAITGEKTLPVLQAAHIRPYSDEGPHAISNGILLRADMHILLDRGYLTVTPDRHILVSKKIHEQFTNGKLYYSYHEKPLRFLPPDPTLCPNEEHLRWHNKKWEQMFAA